MTALVIGASGGHAIAKGDDVIVLPGEMIPQNTGAMLYPVHSLDECLNVIRVRYHKHEDIATLGSTKLVKNADTDWMPAIENHLEMIIDDLGNCAMDSWNGARNAIQQGAYLETCPNLEGLHNALKDQPAVCIGAGPTGQALLKQINPTTHFVFACDAMLAGLPFVPHFTCMVERIPECFQFVRDHAAKGSRLIAPPVVDPIVPTAFLGKCLWWMASDPLYSWLSPTTPTAFAGRSSGTLTVSAALLAGCNPIYLVGHDLAYDNGVSHADSAHAICLPEHQRVTTPSHIHHMKRYQVPANGGGTVESCGLFSVFRQDIELIVRSYPNRTVINCGGLSKIRGTTMGELPQEWRPVVEPIYPVHPMKNWIPEIPRIKENMQRIKKRCAEVIIRLEMDSDTAAIAEMMAVSSMVEPDMALLFNYIFRALGNNLNLRLHYRATHGGNPDREHRAVLRTLAETTFSMCDEMAAQL